MNETIKPPICSVRNLEEGTLFSLFHIVFECFQAVSDQKFCLCCVLSPCQRCGTGCSCGVSSPRSLSTGRWGCSCWSCCSATRGAASSRWCWSAWVSSPPSPEASSPVSPITLGFFVHLVCFFVFVCFFCQLTSTSSIQSSQKKTGGDREGKRA